MSAQLSDSSKKKTDEKTRQEKVDLAWKLMKDMRKGMLNTNDGSRVVGRPMALTQDEFNGKLYFFTDVRTNKVEQIHENSLVAVSFSNPGDDKYVHVDGSASIIKDQEMKDRYWSKVFELWYPEGKDASNVVLIEINVKNIEYWDSDNFVSQAIEASRSMLKNERAELGDNEEVALA